MPHLITPVSITDHHLGIFGAPTTLVEYGDYQCLTCKMASPVIKQLIKNIELPFCFAFRHFPLKEKHPCARIAAEAAEAAAMQNKFWEMHELLYQNQFLLNPDIIEKLALQLNLDVPQFNTDRRSSAISLIVETEFYDGVRSGVNGTPCFYINGERYDGDPSYEALKTALTAKS